MQADDVAKLLESTQASAEAVAKVAQALEKRFGDEKKEKFSEASRVIRQPDLFHPKNYEEEITMWPDWRLSFRSWLIYACEDFKGDLDKAETANGPMEFIDMSLEQHSRAEKLHSILVGLLRGRPLKLLRSVEDGNGLEVWRELTCQLAPRTRARSLSLLQAFLNHPNFSKEKHLLEQVLGLERIAEEYHTVAKEEISDNTKLSVLLRVVPQQLRQHLQLQLDEAATYAVVRERVLAYERTTTSWTSQAVYRELDIKDSGNRNDEAVPMEIDRVKGKSKGKQKGKGKSGKDGKDGKGKGGWKGDGKSKGKGYGYNYGYDVNKGKGKNYGKASGEKGKGKLPYDACKLCGARGHWSKECPVRSLRQVTDGTKQAAGSPQAAGSTASGSGGGAQSQTTVRRVQIVDLDLDEGEEPDAEGSIRMVKTEEVYDMTYSDEDEDWCVCGLEGDGVVYFDSFTGGTACPFGGKNGKGGSRPSECGFIRGVTRERAVSMVLDSGADMSVLPLEFKEIGVPLSKRSVLRDAQGNVMRGGTLRQAVIILEDQNGNQVHMRETFGLANVNEPLLALGKLIKKGWKVIGEKDGVQLSYGAFSKSVHFRNNSLVTEAVIRKVETKVINDVKVRAVTMSFDAWMRNMLSVPGWHLTLDRRVPFLVKFSSKNYSDCYPQLNRVEFPYRSTMILKGLEWELVEVADRSQSEGEIEECNGELTTVVSFFTRELEDLHCAGTVSTGEDDPFFKPKEREAAEQEKEKQGFGWFGKTLEDGVYEIEDDDDDAQMGVQHEGAEGDPHQRVLPEGPGDGELEEIEIEGEKYNKRSSLRKLREGLRLYGLPKGRSKDDACRRLVTHHNNLAENLGVEIARREFERRKQDEGGD